MLSKSDAPNGLSTGIDNQKPNGPVAGAASGFDLARCQRGATSPGSPSIFSEIGGALPVQTRQNT